MLNSSSIAVIRFKGGIDPSFIAPYAKPLSSSFRSTLKIFKKTLLYLSSWS
jgi:hypothetical protein